MVIDKASGWQFLKKDCPAEWVMATPGQPAPERPECGDESDWPLDFPETPACPWKFAHFLYLMDVDSGETLTFSSSTSVGKSPSMISRSRLNPCAHEAGRNADRRTE